MADEERGAVKTNKTHRDELRYSVEGHALAIVDKVVGDAGRVSVFYIGGNIARLLSEM